MFRAIGRVMLVAVAIWVLTLPTMKNPMDITTIGAYIALASFVVILWRALHD